MIFTKIKSSINKYYVKTLIKNEKTFTGECQLKYLFMPDKRSNILLVIFSGIPTKQTPLYSYVLKIRNIKCNKLYILDNYGFDFRGSYYLGQNRDFFIERSIHSLIDKIREQSYIDKKCIVCAGSSKGGFASLFFAFKYGYTAVVGAPQYLLGDYFCSRSPDHNRMMEYISGGTSEDDRAFLNSILKEEIEKSTFKPQIHIHVSINEHHYEEHIIPLTKKLDEVGIKYNIDLGEYYNHSDVGNYFPSFLKRVLKENRI